MLCASHQTRALSARRLRIARTEAISICTKQGQQGRCFASCVDCCSAEKHHYKVVHVEDDVIRTYDVQPVCVSSCASSVTRCQGRANLFQAIVVFLWFAKEKNKSVLDDEAKRELGDYGLGLTRILAWK
jgi:hypothetical protein